VEALARDLPVHVPNLTADEGFIRFDLAESLVLSVILHRQSNPVQHVHAHF